MRLLAACLGCGRAATIWCDECERWCQSVAAPANAVLPDDGPARNLLRAAKFAGATRGIDIIARLTLDRAPRLDVDLPGVAGITWAAPAIDRTEWRGHHVPERLARSLASQLGVPGEPLLTRTHDRRLRHLSETDRSTLALRANRLAIAELSHSMAHALARGPLLIIDDVRTTGATLQAATAHCAPVARHGVVVLAATGVARRHPRQHANHAHRPLGA